MRNNFLKFFLLSFLVFFYSCSNFFNGSELKQEIEKQIAYANSSEFLINVITDNTNYGTFQIGSGEHHVKNGDTFEINFKTNSLYTFVEYNIYDATTLTEIKDSGIKFDSPGSEKTIIRLVNVTSNIIIKPKCVKNPIIINWGPIYNSEGTCKESQIFCTFEEPVSIDSFRFLEEEIPESSSALYDGNNRIYAYKINEITTLKNIIIKNSSGQSVENKFLIPELDTSNTRLTIKPNPDNLPSSEDELILITICENVFSSENKQAILGQNQKEWNYKVSDKRDSDYPIIDRINIGESETSVFNNDFQTYSELKSNLVQKFYEETTHKYYIDNFWITVTAHDATTSVDSVKIKETLLYTNEGIPSGSVKEFYINTLEKDSDLNDILKPYQYYIQSPYDGVFKINFSVIDSTGKETSSDKEYIFIKDSIAESDSIIVYNIKNDRADCSLFENKIHFLNSTLSLEENIKEINNRLKTITIEINEPTLTYNNGLEDISLYKTKEDIVNISFKAGTKMQSLKEYPLTYVSTESSGSIIYTTNIDNITQTEDLLLVVDVLYKNGNSVQKIHQFPRQAKLPNIVLLKNDKYELGEEIIYPNIYDNSLVYSGRAPFYYFESKNGVASILKGPNNYTSVNTSISDSYTWGKNTIPYQNDMYSVYIPMSFYNYEVEDVSYFLLSGITKDHQLKISDSSNVSEESIDFSGCTYSIETNYNEKCYYINYTVPESSNGILYTCLIPTYDAYGNSINLYCSTSGSFKEYFFRKKTIDFYATDILSGKTIKSVSYPYFLEEADFIAPDLTTDDGIYFKSDASGFYKRELYDDGTGIKEINYWYALFDEKWTEEIENEGFYPKLDGTEIPAFAARKAKVPDIKNTSPIKNTITNQDTSFKRYDYYPAYFSLAGLEDGKYTLVATGTDKAGNSVSPLKKRGLGVFGITTLPKNLYTISYSSGSLTVSLPKDKIDNYTEDSTSKNLISVYYNDDTDEWKPIEQYEKFDTDEISVFNDYASKMTKSGSNYISETNIPNEINSRTNLWVKINYAKEKFSSYKYRIPPYYKYIGTFSEDSKLKRLEAITPITYLISSDIPCLVETLQSPKDFGDDIEKWDLCSDSTNLKTFDNGSSWYYLDLDKIEEGFYYVIRVYFADGKYRMSEVMHK